MAAPTATTYTEPHYVVNVTGTNVDAGNNTYDVEFGRINPSIGWSIVTGTLTNMDVTILADNGAGVYDDITADLFPSISVLASNTAYIFQQPLPVKVIRINAARSNATNAVNFRIFVPKGR